MPSSGARWNLLGRAIDATRASDGQTIVEYALIVGVISVGVAVLLTGFGQSLLDAAEAAVEALTP